MLSRTADHLFWMARYMERAENTARMLDVNYQMSLLPQSEDAAERGWRGLLSINEISGETTSARPRRVDGACGSTTAGAWKHSDLPPPVGSTTTLSRPSRTACIASRCSGRKSENPQTR